jgi:hypothetical protein
VRLDTASISAIVVLDSTSSLDAGEVSRFVANGGGLVASGAGVNHPAIRPILRARARGESAGELGGLLGPSPREGLQARTFLSAPEVVPLERRGNAPVVFARRVGSGRAIAIGYDDTWRTRMTPASDAAPESHRMWWSSLVASVAHSKPLPRDVGPVDEAPLAATVAALGPPVIRADQPRRGPAIPWDACLAVLAAGALLAEWLSRRLRGVA